jgi:hypothetical protein
MTNHSVIANKQIQTTDGIITSISESVTQTSPKKEYCKIIDGKNGYVIPGLIDAHVHQHRPEIQDSLTLFKLHIANGVLVVRNLADFPGQDAIESRRQSELKGVIAPKYLTSGPHLNAGNLKTTDDAISTVKTHVEKGYDFIKIHGNLEKRVYLTLLEEAYKARIPVVGHAQRHLPLDYSLRMNELSHVEELVAIALQRGQQPIELKDYIIDDIVKRVKNSGITIIPSLSIIRLIPDYTDEHKFLAMQKRSITRFMAFEEFEWFTNKDNPSYQSAHFKTPFMQKYISDLYLLSQRFTKKLSEAGVPLVAGSDNLGFHIAGFSLHDELEEMVKAGLTPFDALKSATVTSARHLGLQPLLGTIEEGKKAEFLLLENNPLELIQHTRKLNGVMSKGKWHSKQDLDALLCSAAEDRKSAWPPEALAKIEPLFNCKAN